MKKLIFIVLTFAASLSVAQGTIQECFREDGSGFLFKLVVDLSSSQPKITEMARYANQPDGKWSQTCWLNDIINVSGTNPTVILGTWQCPSVFARTTFKVFSDHVTAQRENSRFIDSYECK